MLSRICFLLLASYSSLLAAEVRPPKVLSDQQNAEIIKFTILNAKAIKLSIDPKTDDEEKKVFFDPAFDLSLYLLRDLVNNNVLTPTDKTTWVSGVAGVCDDAKPASCSLRIESDLLYKRDQGYSDELGTRKLTINFKTNLDSTTSIYTPDPNSYELLVEYVSP